LANAPRRKESFPVPRLSLGQRFVQHSRLSVLVALEKEHYSPTMPCYIPRHPFLLCRLKLIAFQATVGSSNYFFPVLGFPDASSQMFEALSGIFSSF
jgi:hypothetical protein